MFVRFYAYYLQSQFYCMLIVITVVTSLLAIFFFCKWLIARQAALDVGVYAVSTKRNYLSSMAQVNYLKEQHELYDEYRRCFTSILCDLRKDVMFDDGGIMVTARFIDAIIDRHGLYYDSEFSCFLLKENND